MLILFEFHLLIDSFNIALWLKCFSKLNAKINLNCFMVFKKQLKITTLF